MVNLQQVIAAVRQLQIHGKALVGQLFRVQHDTHVVEYRLRVHALRGGAHADTVCARAVSQLERRDQIDVSPCAGLSLIAQLLQCVGAEIPRVLIGRIGKDQRVRNRGNRLLTDFLCSVAS